MNPKSAAVPKASLARLYSFLAEGLCIGFVATQALDVVSGYLYESLSEEERRKEDRTRGGHQAYEVMAMRAASSLGRELDEKQIKFWGWRLHRAVGWSGGLQYLALRRLFPKVGRAMGLGFGVGFFLVADEALIYAARATPGPTRFSWKAHLRGAIAHIAYGVAAEFTARSFDRIAPYANGAGIARAEDRAIEKPAPSIGIDERLAFA